MEKRKIEVLTITGQCEEKQTRCVEFTVFQYRACESFHSGLLSVTDERPAKNALVETHSECPFAGLN